MAVSRFPSALAPTDVERSLTDLARATIDAPMDAGPNEDGVQTMYSAIRAADGRTFVGVNLHHFTGVPFAELVLLGAARVKGARGLTHIVAVGNHERGVTRPFGRDRQILSDQYPGIRVILPSLEDL